MPSRQSTRKRGFSAIDWPSRIREVGLRSTALTVNALQALSVAAHPYSHDELTKDLATDGLVEKVDRVTLYRILDRLTQAGLIVRIQGSDRAWRYAIAETTAHGYFECEQCHELTALPSDPDLASVLVKLQQRLNRSGAHSATTAVTVHGTCKNCVHRNHL